jgi:ATP-binding cassette subfamily F protein uup
LGLNGAGKSTLLRVLGGQDAPDAGVVERKVGAHVAFLTQEPDLAAEKTAEQIVAEGLGAWSEVAARYHALSDGLAKEGDPHAVAEQARLGEQIERLGGWSREHEVLRLLENLGMRDPGKLVVSMSGGERRRVALARLLISSPDLAILDEPTNHLDAETITWLERYFADTFQGALLIVTHDRYFLDAVCTEIVELEHGQLNFFDGGYSDYLEEKAVRLALADRAEQTRLNLVRRETEWLRRGPKARSTKQKARIDRAHALIDKGPPPADAKVSFGGLERTAARAGKIVLELDDLEVARNGRTLVKKLTLGMRVGDRVGIVGPNGAGKSSLLAIVEDELAPVRGTLKKGLHTKLAHFDQTRARLEETWSVYDNVAGWQGAEVTGGGQVDLGDEQVDLRVYLERFLFDRHRQRQVVGSLSGGERARVALAKTLRSGANLLLLDEPTNDLDTFTLSALEDLLERWPVALLVVSHDRYFLNRVATRILVLDGAGGATVYSGNYETYERLLAEKQAADAQATGPAKVAEAPARAVKPAAPKSGLTYAERLEFDKILDVVAEAEGRVNEWSTKLTDPVLYSAGPEAMKKVKADHDEAERALADAMARWEFLEAKKGGA